VELGARVVVPVVYRLGVHPQGSAVDPVRPLKVHLDGLPVVFRLEPQVLRELFQVWQYLQALHLRENESP